MLQNQKITHLSSAQRWVFYELHCEKSGEEIYSVGHRQFCPNMKMVRLEGVKEARDHAARVNLDEEMQKAALPLEKMLKLGSKPGGQVKWLF